MTSLLGAHGALHSHVFDPSTHLHVHTSTTHTCANVHRFTHTHADLHLLPLCATLVHLIDDAVSLLLLLSNARTHTHTHTHLQASTRLLLSVSSKLYPVLHCPLFFLPFPCPVATVQLLAVLCVYVCLHVCAYVCDLVLGWSRAGGSLVRHIEPIA